MYNIVLATVLAAGNAAPAADIYADIRDLKNSVAELRQEQTDARIDELKLVIAGLRERITDAKLDELRRDVRLLQRQEEELIYGIVPLPSVHMAPSTARAQITVKLPARATFVVNKEEVPVPAVNPTFITPPLEAGRDYYYDCKVTCEQDGKTVTKTKRVKVHAGAVIHLDFDDMEAP